MTNMPPSDPESSKTNALGFDEFIGVLVAFATIGTILFWSFSRKDSTWNINGVLSPSPSTSPSIQPNQGFPSSIPEVEPNVASTSPLSLPTPTVESSSTPLTIDKVTRTPLLPPNNTAPNNSLQVQALLPSSTKAIKQQFSLVSPSKKKSTIPPPIAFNDVPADFWGRRYINVLSSRGVIKGFPDYSFRPNQPVNRAEFAAILQQAFDQEPAKTTTIKLKDIKEKFWATPAINQAISKGFLKGYPNKTFKPKQNILRVQVLVALASGLNLKTPAFPNQVLKIYKDAKDIPKYATAKIASATVNGLVVNYPDPKIFAPNKEATRAEVAAMVHQALVLMGRLEEIPSKSIVRLPQ
ncbi:MAG: S-layer homology domain-containing protein [Mojavia pulchra JT2-VF2]|jgi:hypothetical protein|uniref:S-layer homology domain-containing protein n=1 Tax=Mojavia pulchra JT2-VF2 TaxID=287848 RepID=A0A951PT91_9NOST|nr:S-layer homology domain-containing protein [Mojavia pulchra JT2-VF2]